MILAGVLGCQYHEAEEGGHDTECEECIEMYTDMDSLEVGVEQVLEDPEEVTAADLLEAPVKRGGYLVVAEIRPEFLRDEAMEQVAVDIGANSFFFLKLELPQQVKDRLDAGESTHFTVPARLARATRSHSVTRNDIHGWISRLTRRDKRRQEKKAERKKRRETQAA